MAGLAPPGLLRSSGWLLFGAAVSRGAMLVASVLVARTIVPADFGKLNLMQTAVTLLSGFAGLGLALAVTRQVAEARAVRPEIAGRYLGSALVLTLAGGIAVAAALGIGRVFFARVLLHDGELGNLVAASAGAVLFAALNAAIQASLMGLEAFRSMAAAQWAQGFAAGAGLVAGAVANAAAGALVGFSVGQAIAAVASFVLLHRAAKAQAVVVTYRLERRAVRELWRFGLPTFCGFLALSAAMLGGQVILSHQHDGFSQVAIFNNAYRWHLAILFVPSAIAPVLVPVMTRLGASRRGREVAALFRGSTLGLLGLAIAPAIVVAAGAPLVLGLSGGFYSRHPLPLIVLAAASVPAALNAVLSTTSVSLGAIREWLFSDLVLASVLVGTAALLVTGSHATGLALAYLLGYVATDLALAVPLVKRLRAASSEG
jgi:O-antigen/teichoic acid export membrane protein